MEAQSVVLKCLVFLRSDVYEHLLQETPDKGKDTAIRLDWNDPAVFEQILDRRIEVSTLLKGSFREKWRELAESHIGPEDSFNYILDRTLMRPRDLLMFVQRAVEVALNRGHGRIMAEDIRQAEASFSEDMLIALEHEIHDTQPDLDDVLYTFIGSSSVLSGSEVEELVRTAGASKDAMRATTALLVWFGFLGVEDSAETGDKYSFQVRYDLKRLLRPIEQGKARFVIHPAFRLALETDNSQLRISA